MELSLDPKTQRFVDEQVREGRYASPQDVVREALARMEADELAPTTAPDDQAWTAIDRAQAEFDAGQDRPFEEVADELRTKYLKQRGGAMPRIYSVRITTTSQVTTL